MGGNPHGRLPSCESKLSSSPAPEQREKSSNRSYWKFSAAAPTNSDKSLLLGDVGFQNDLRAKEMHDDTGSPNRVPKTSDNSNVTKLSSTTVLPHRSTSPARDPENLGPSVNTAPHQGLLVCNPCISPNAFPQCVCVFVGFCLGPSL